MVTAAQKDDLESLWWLGVYDDPEEYCALSDEARQVIDNLDDRFHHRVQQILHNSISVDSVDVDNFIL